MLYTPPFSWKYYESNQSIAANPVGTSVTTAPSSTGKSAETPTQLIASTGGDAYWIHVCCQSYAASGTDSAGLCDIMHGAAGSESVLIPDLMIGQASAFGFGKHYSFPLYIPAGTRLSARAQGQRLSTAFRVYVALYGEPSSPTPFPIGSKITAYGPNAGINNNGVAITPGNNAEGAWTQVEAATDEEHFYLYPGFQHAGDTSMVTHDYAIEMGIGAATEKSISWDWHFLVPDATENEYGPLPAMGIWGDFAVGERLSMRAYCNGSPDTCDCAIYAVS
jgi:hypothetical protein